MRKKDSFLEKLIDCLFIVILRGKQKIPINSDITFEDIADAVIKLFSLEKVQSNENGNIIEIKDKHLAEFVEQFMKMRDFIFSSDCPDYAKTSLKRTIIKNFSKKFCITNGVITLTPEYTAEAFSEDF